MTTIDPAVARAIREEQSHRRYLKKDLGIFVPNTHKMHLLRILDKVEQTWQERASAILALCVQTKLCEAFKSKEHMQDWWIASNAKYTDRLAQGQLIRSWHYALSLEDMQETKK